MGKIWIPGGGGADLDLVTAEAGDVVAGKVIVDKNGDPLTGTLTLSGNAAAADVRKGKTFYNTNAKSRLTGTMAEKGAATYTPGRSNQTIAANQYLTGAQTIRGDANLLAANIKKGVPIFGLTGTWEGYVAGITDVYYNGSSTSDFIPDSDIIFQSNQIYVNKVDYGTIELTTLKSYNYTPFKRLNIDVLCNYNISSFSFKLTVPPSTGTYGTLTCDAGVRKTYYFDITNYNNTAPIRLSVGCNCCIYRIWFS